MMDSTFISLKRIRNNLILFLSTITMYYLILIIPICILVLIVIYFIWFKLRHPFWAKQPVFHYHDIYHHLFPNRIIEPALPIKNKYFNYKNIVVKKTNELSQDEKINIIKLIQNNYYKENKYYYRPLNRNVFPYFLNHTEPCYISLYYINKELVGVLTSRPVYIKFKHISLTAYYADFLCIHKKHRKKYIAAYLIQTHQYHQSYNNLNINVSLFKKERYANYFISLVYYNTYFFNITLWDTIPLHNSVKIRKITDENIHTIIDFMQKTKKKYKCFISISMGNLLELIKTRNIIVYGTFIGSVCHSCYFFRDITTYYNKKPAIELFTSIKACSDELFIHAFSNVMFCMKQNYDFILLENVSDTSYLLNNILLKHKYIFKEKTFFQLYNYAQNTILPEEFAYIL